MTTKHFVPFFLEAHNTFKMLHWFTSSYAEHVALDKLVESFQSLSDQFVEVYIGKHGRNSATLKKDVNNITVAGGTSAAKGVSSVLDECVRYCSTELNKYISAKDTDLSNIRDELIAVLNQTKYLVALR
jgi:hypothetical protein